MKKMIKIGALLLVTAIIFQSCADDDDDPVVIEPTASMTFNFESTVGSEPLQLYHEFNDFKDRKFQVELFKFYVSNIAFIDKNNKSVPVTDVQLLDYANSMKFTVNVKAGKYTGVHMGIGLDAEQNASDPATFKDSHPLSTAQGSHWGWAAKYRFIQLDGKADVTGDGMLNQGFSYHTGLDTMYQTKTMMYDFEVKEDVENNLYFTVDMNEIFSLKETVDYFFEANWHGSPENAEIGIKLTNNFVESLHIRNE